jgi:hypothetical protein
MGLLDTTAITMREFYGKYVPAYAILSHTWDEEEVTFQDFLEDRNRLQQLRGYKKIISCCRLASDDGYQYLWVDTCCINKNSSAKLSEAINSMYEWYHYAGICYAYLGDMDDAVEIAANARSMLEEGPTMSADEIMKESRLASSRWFSRGWTLQELLATSHVRFYSRDWQYVGSKFGLRHIISSITSIRPEILASGDLRGCSIAEKFSWASYRKTTRVEDSSYCLLGLFNVNMPLLYGEGERAFIRLQEEIIRTQEDLSILLWTAPDPSISTRVGSDVLSTTPHFFSQELIMTKHPGLQSTAHSLSQLERVSLFSRQDTVRSLPGIFRKGIFHLASDPPLLTNRGLAISLNIFQMKFDTTSLATTLCAWTYYMSGEKFVCLVLKEEQVATDTVYSRVGHLQLVADSDIAQAVLRRVFLAVQLPSTSTATTEATNFEEPTLVLQGIKPEPEVMEWWDKIYLENTRSKTEHSTSRYTLASIFSLENHITENHDKHPYRTSWWTRIQGRELKGRQSLCLVG